MRRLARAQLPGLESTLREHFDEESATTDAPESLVYRVRGGDMVLIDTRPRSEFESGHVAGARSVPLDELEERLEVASSR